jgi:hypothetical protein
MRMISRGLQVAAKRSDLVSPNIARAKKLMSISERLGYSLLSWPTRPLTLVVKSDDEYQRTVLVGMVATPRMTKVCTTGRPMRNYNKKAVQND